jgi:hypothetical protein
LVNFREQCVQLEAPSSRIEEEEEEEETVY